MFRVIIADDHYLIREGIKKIFEYSRNYIIIGEASNGDEAMHLIDQYSCDLLISDISMPNGMDGLDLSIKVKRKYKEIKIILLTMFTDESYIFNAIKVNVDGMISKDSLHTEIFLQLNQIMNGQKYFLGKTPAELELFLKALNQSGDKFSDVLKTLTKREISVFKLIGEGFSSVEIANKLFIDKRTVDSHRTHIMGKLNIKSLPELILKSSELFKK
ncbi:MAG: response regulator transcription factor [Melioribacteraceae bacterium]|nr:response regulator transcription factor [Melioribacteraceae bacterium]